VGHKLGLRYEQGDTVTTSTVAPACFFRYRAFSASATKDCQNAPISFAIRRLLVWMLAKFKVCHSRNLVKIGQQITKTCSKTYTLLCARLECKSLKICRGSGEKRLISEAS
jgi:hypothetical protein